MDYNQSVYSRSNINKMWILNILAILDEFNSRTFSKISFIKIFDFSTLYTTIHYEKSKTCLNEIIHNANYFKNGKQRYKFMVLGHELTYFVKHETKARQTVLH